MKPAWRGINFLAGLLFLGVDRGFSDEKKECDPKITAVRNEVRTEGAGTNQAVDVGHSVKSGEAVATGSQGLAEIRGNGSTTVRVGEKSRVSLDAEKNKVRVDQGTVLIHSSETGAPVEIEAGGVKITVEQKDSTNQNNK